jgi:hypothetical protein
MLAIKFMSLTGSSLECATYPLTLVLTESHINHFDDPDTMDTLRRASQIFALKFSRTDSQDVEDRGRISIEDSEYDRVMRCFQYIVDELTRVDEDQDTLSIVLLVPESFRAYSRESSPIERISAASRALISFKDSPGEDGQKLCIQGEHAALKAAVGEVYRTILRSQSKYVELSSIQFIIPSNCAGYIIGRDGFFTKSVRESFNVTVKIFKASGPPCKTNESILSLSGTLSNIRTSFPTLFTKVGEALELLDKYNHLDNCGSGEDMRGTGGTVNVKKVKQGREYGQDASERTRLLVPSKIAASVIGIGGLTVQEIAKKSQGSMIRVMLDKPADRENRLAEISIRGPQEARIKAVNLIIERLEGDLTAPSSASVNPRSRVRSRSRSSSRHSHTPMRPTPAPLNLQAPSHISTRDPDCRSPVQTAVSLAVADVLVSRLVGKGGENVKALMSRSGCSMIFQQQANSKIQTPTGSLAQLCTVTGSIDEIAQGVKLLLEQIKELEKRQFP